ncbi:unnamed protein product [marine sediment metagenome]|uniref:Uncharacterized protein n=1 Tax=marine sediment metagenome TaxID=412755 RepID=X1QZ13_9ZZZZ
MLDIAGIVGAVSGSLSLLGIVYLFGVWRGKVDSALNELKNYPPAEMWTMTKTLWDIYVVEALHHRPDLAERGSSFKLKKEGEDLIPEYMKPLLKRIPRNPLNSEGIASGYLVVKHIGLELIGKMAEDKQLNVQEAIAILSCYLETHS